MWITTGAVLDRKRPRVPAGSTRLAVSCSPRCCAKAAVAASAARTKNTVLNSAGFLVCFMVLLLDGRESRACPARPYPFKYVKREPDGRPFRPAHGCRPGSVEVGRPVAVVVVVIPVAVVVAVMIPVAVVAVIAVVAPGAVGAGPAAVVASELVHQLVDPAHAAVDVGTGLDPAQRPGRIVEGVLQGCEGARRAAGLPAVALGRLVEAGGLVAQLAKLVDGAGLGPVRTAVVALELA